MKGVRSFIIGFSLSLASVSAYGQLFYSPAASTFSQPVEKNIKIDLFKTQSEENFIKPVNVFAKIQKNILTESVQTADVQETLNFETAINAPDDDEILSVNIDGVIPIEFENTDNTTKQAEILHFENEEISAMLPTQIDNNNDFSVDTPWVIAKGGKHIKNKQLLEDFNNAEALPKLTDNFISTLENSEENSYKVAEKIKSSLLFPIPSEILNDENLVPTFIKKTKQPNTQKKQFKPQTVVESTQTLSKDNLKIVPKVSTQTEEKEASSKGLFGSISSWFSSDENNFPEISTKNPPSYSSQGKAIQPRTSPSDSIEFVNFYKTLQETSAAHKNNTIIPSELKLSFQPERAEISGQTLRWLKAFSEAAQNDDTYLQVRLDVSASTELQKKRLNLLYTIFMNNGVDFKKIDTVFSLTEPNAFIIRTLKQK